MKLRKITALVSILMLLFFYAASIRAFAADETATDSFSLRFSLLTDDGSQVFMAHKNDIITVNFLMERTDSQAAYTTNGFQNYIYYDTSFFELVEDSIVCYDTGKAIAKKQNSITHGQIIQCQNMANTYEASLIFCSFRLKVIGDSGSGMIYNGETYAFDTSHKAVSVIEQNLRVIVEENHCQHEEKTTIEEKESSCTEEGWHSYRVCDDCGMLFNETKEEMIADIPYIERSHPTSAESIGSDALWHWYTCTTCNERVEQAAHYGGSASCGHKANCELCGHEYGNLAGGAHTGNTVVKNDKKASYYKTGYTGDVYCADCGVMLEEGEIIPATPRTELTIAGIAVFSVVLIVLAYNITRD